MIEDVYSVYRELYVRLERGKSGLIPPSLDHVVATVTAHKIDRNAVQQQAIELSRHPGWIRLQSAVYRTGNGQEFAADDGLPLMGEWVLSETASTHLRQDGKGGWPLFHYQEYASLQDAENASGNKGAARDCLRERVTVIAADVPASAVNPDQFAYDVYWSLEDGAMRRLFARFAGFISRNGG